MKLIVRSITENPASLLRRAGYAFQHQGQNEMSFVRVLGRASYPRFHCYTTVVGTDLHVNLHLDQKKHTYGNTTRHHGEYEDSAAVNEEFQRLRQFFGTPLDIF